MKRLKWKAQKHPEEKKAMKDYLIVEEQKPSFEEKIKKIRFHKKVRNILLFGGIIILIISFFFTIPVFFPSPFKGRFSYIQPFGIYNEDIQDIYMGQVKEDSFQIDAFDDTKVQMELGNVVKVVQKQDGEWSERNLFEVRLHLPWEGEKIPKTGVYKTSEIISYDEKGESQINKEVQSLYPKKLLSKFLQYGMLGVQGRIEQIGNVVNSGYNFSEIEVKEQEIIFSYILDISIHSYNTHYSVPKQEEVILNITEWSQLKNILGTYQFPIVWNSPETVDNIKQLGNTLLFEHTVIFYRITENENPLHKISQIEIHPIETRANSNEICLTTFKHYAMLEGYKDETFYLEQNGKKLKEEVTVTDYNWQNIEGYYEINEEQPDYFVIPYVFEEKERKHEKVMTLPVPKEDGSFDGTYSFHLNGDGESTEVKIKKAYWNKEELEYFGMDSLCYELEIIDTGSKKELDNLKFEILGIEEVNSLYQFDIDLYRGINRGIAWQGETPYLIVSYMSPERLEGKEEWQIAITSTIYRYKQPLKIPLKKD